MRLFFVIAIIFSATISLRGTETVGFARDVAPILQKYCAACHTADDENGGLSMDTHAALMRGGESGPAVTQGEPGSSRVLLMASGKLKPAMPPEGEEGPSEDELAVLSAWIEQGAVGKRGDMPLRQELRTPKIPPANDVDIPITSIALSADGKLKAIARFGSVQILRADDSVVTTLEDRPGKVNSLQFSKDATKLLVASGVTGAYGLASIHQVETGDLLVEMAGHRDTLYAAVLSPDETRVATAGYDREIVLWDAVTGEPIRKFSGHNGAIFDLAFSPDGVVLASACADETVKIWHVETARRLDTLSQPEGEVLAVEITPDGNFVLAGSADNRLRVWKLKSKERPRINPIVATRFIDESPLVNFKLTPDGKSLVVLSEQGHVKVVRTSDWNQFASLEPLDDLGSDSSISPDGSTVTISLMNGTLVTRKLPHVSDVTKVATERLRPIYMDLGEPSQGDENTLRQQQQAEPSIASLVGSESDHPIRVDRGADVTGVINEPGQSDRFAWAASAGEVWAIDVDAIDTSPIDPIVTVMDASGDPVLRTRLQAVRDSYFTFRGKDSNQVGDFRLFNWQEMHLSEYLYAAGEVTRLWMHPRGPDSGFNVYPGEGNRWTYFGTSHTTHALGEPAHIVRPLEPGEPPVANGLPVFDVYYENDDDPMRLAGKNCRLLFTAPADGTYIVRVADTTGGGGEAFKYKLAIRAAVPGFKPTVQQAAAALRRGTGREFIVRVDRSDGFDGPVTFDVADFPAGLKSNAPITIQRGQRYAVGSIWADESTPPWEGKVAVELVASAEINGRLVQRRVGKAGEFTLGDPPSVVPSIQPTDRSVAEGEDWTLQVRRGATVSARVVLRRKEGFKAEVSFGKEDSGRNASQGVYVDNIGLNGLLVLAEMNEREFFLTADPTAVPGRRSFFLKANVDGGVTSHPITVEVLP
jgi:WD40 repeat protein